ncbi:hypothetical protein LCGC14_1327600 [marine sediment metagenome]|uniref:Uncharacterized protein n=1 Tax=marine sediment metagenome TaxID=412755 RepID=A0A0F9L3F9_9ZZZZ
MTRPSEERVDFKAEATDLGGGLHAFGPPPFRDSFESRLHHVRRGLVEARSHMVSLTQEEQALERILGNTQ